MHSLAPFCAIQVAIQNSGQNIFFWTFLTYSNVPAFTALRDVCCPRQPKNYCC